MKAGLVKRLTRLRSSYWFLPGLMAFAATALATLVLWIDSVGWSRWIDSIPWLGSGNAEGARVLLSTVAGSMITVAGVTFSMTVLAVSHAGAQLGPRTLTNLLRDRGNQVTLGVFTATFLYCLLILRAVGSTEGSFVPRLGVLVALVLAIASVGVLIYFVHHVPRTIHATDVVARIGRRLRESIESASAPARDGAGRGRDGVAEPSSVFRGEPVSVVRSARVGYVNYVSYESLTAAADAQDCRVTVIAPAGQFVYEGTPLIELRGRGAPSDSLDPAPFRGSFAVGTRRSIGQDVLFPADQLLEVAIRALSPGVNDPYTAIECVDQLMSSAALLARSPDPPAEYQGEDGELRVLARPVFFPPFVRHVLGRLRPYMTGDALVSAHTLRCLAALSRDVPRLADLDALVAEATDTAAAMGESAHPEAQQHFSEILERARRARQASSESKGRWANEGGAIPSVEA